MLENPGMSGSCYDSTVPAHGKHMDASARRYARKDGSSRKECCRQPDATPSRVQMGRIARDVNATRLSLNRHSCESRHIYAISMH